MAGALELNVTDELTGDFVVNLLVSDTSGLYGTFNSITVRPPTVRMTTCRVCVCLNCLLLGFRLYIRHAPCLLARGVLCYDLAFRMRKELEQEGRHHRRCRRRYASLLCPVALRTVSHVC